MSTSKQAEDNFKVELVLRTVAQLAHDFAKQLEDGRAGVVTLDLVRDLVDRDVLSVRECAEYFYEQFNNLL